MKRYFFASINARNSKLLYKEKKIKNIKITGKLLPQAKSRREVAFSKSDLAAKVLLSPRAWRKFI